MEETKEEKKKSFPLIPVILIIVFLLIGGVVFSGFYIKSKFEQNFGINGIKVDTSNNTYKLKAGNMDTEVTENKSLSWPSDLPTDIPKYDSGKIKSISHSKGENIWVMTIAETNEEYFKKYQEILAGNGWKSGEQVSLVVSMAQMKKGDSQITLTYDTSSKGVLISINPVK